MYVYNNSSGTYIPIPSYGWEYVSGSVVQADNLLQKEWERANQRAMERSANGFKDVVVINNCRYCGRKTSSKQEFCLGCGAPV